MLKHRLTTQECSKLFNSLIDIKINPYQDYLGFKKHISTIIESGKIPNRLHHFLNDSKDKDPSHHPFIFIENLPLDPILPYFDNQNPVEEKRSLKTTFIAESILEIFAQIRNENPIGYLNVNQGDVFQDIFPKTDLYNSQSQKALNEIRFHKDLANHFVQPDWVNIFCLRNDIENIITTAFTRNIDILNNFSNEEKQELSSLNFHTPYDDLSTYKSLVELGEANRHAILPHQHSHEIRFFENRTQGLTPRAEELISKLVRLVHQYKVGIHLRPGDLIASQNNYSLHCKEILALNNEYLAKKRWLMKTVNVADYKQIIPHAVEGKEWLVNG
jgi:L-asparagine oxygenase